MDLFLKHANYKYFHNPLLKGYTQKDLFIRSLNLCRQFKKDTKYILLFLPNCKQYIECVFASILANVHCIHCSYNNILKHVFTPEIDFIFTTRKYWDIILKLLGNCNDLILKSIKDKVVIINDTVKTTTKLVLTSTELKAVYTGFLETSNSRQIFPVLNDITQKQSNHNYLHISVQYLQHKSLQTSVVRQQSYPCIYNLNTLKGICNLFQRIQYGQSISSFKVTLNSIPESFMIPFFDKINCNDNKLFKASLYNNTLKINFKKGKGLYFQQSKDVFYTSTITQTNFKQYALLPFNTHATILKFNYEPLTILFKINSPLKKPVLKSTLKNTTFKVKIEYLNHSIYKEDLEYILSRLQSNFKVTLKLFLKLTLKTDFLIEANNITDQSCIIYIYPDRKTLLFLYHQSSIISHDTLITYIHNKLYRTVTNTKYKFKQTTLKQNVTSETKLLPLKVDELIQILILIITYAIERLINFKKTPIKLLSTLPSVCVKLESNINLLEANKLKKLKQLCINQKVDFKEFLHEITAIYINKLNPSTNIYKVQDNLIFNKSCCFIASELILFNPVFLWIYLRTKKKETKKIKKIQKKIYCKSQNSVYISTQDKFSCDNLQFKNNIGFIHLYEMEDTLNISIFGANDQNTYVIFTELINKIKEYFLYLCV